MTEYSPKLVIRSYTGWSRLAQILLDDVEQKRKESTWSIYSSRTGYKDVSVMEAKQCIRENGLILVMKTTDGEVYDTPDFDFQKRFGRVKNHVFDAAPVDKRPRKTPISRKRICPSIVLDTLKMIYEARDNEGYIREPLKKICEQAEMSVSMLYLCSRYLIDIGVIEEVCVERKNIHGTTRVIRWVGREPDTEMAAAVQDGTSLAYRKAKYQKAARKAEKAKKRIEILTK